MWQFFLGAGRWGIYGNCQLELILLTLLRDELSFSKFSLMQVGRKIHFVLRHQTARPKGIFKGSMLGRCQKIGFSCPHFLNSFSSQDTYLTKVTSPS